MEQFATLTGRNLKLYFRDRGAVFFSLLSMLIVIGLMVLFLGDMSVNGIINFLSDIPGRDASADARNAELLILTWTCAGIISINGVTVTLAVYSVMIKDKATGKINSFYTSPVSRITIVGGYIAAAVIASVCVCVITLVLMEVYCVIAGMEWYSFSVHLQLLGMIVVNSFAHAAIMYWLALIADTEGVWSGIGTVLGTLVGFLGGIYIPIGELSPFIGKLMKCTPVIYGTAMFRNVMVGDVAKQTFVGLPGEALTEYCETMGITLKVYGKELSVRAEWFLLLFCGILFLMIGVCMLRYSKRKDR